MRNLISIAEIPVTNFSRAVKFYQTILDIDIEEMKMGELQMGVFPSDGETVNIVLVKGEDYHPTTHGVLVYLNVTENMEMAIKKIESNGGKILIQKTQISPEMGFFSIFLDSEGNKLGLHSIS